MLTPQERQRIHEEELTRQEVKKPMRATEALANGIIGCIVFIVLLALLPFAMMLAAAIWGAMSN